MADIHIHTHTCPGNKKAEKKTDNEIVLAMWGIKYNSLYELNTTSMEYS